MKLADSVKKSVSEGNTVGGGVAQADVSVTDEFGCRVVHID